MSAEVLRRAASLMRERAEAADLVRGPGAWKADSLTWCDNAGTSHPVHSPGGEVAHGCCEEEAIHIASWHPAVALAVADWLECQADTTCDCGVDESALVLARLYLGEPS